MDKVDKSLTDTSIISIILPVYNGSRFLNEAIQSCLKQTYKNFELIIINDCSTDNSLEIAKKYLAQDERVKIISNKDNQTLPISLNIGHRQAKGDFVTWTSDDNVLKPNYLDQLYKGILRENCDIIFSNYDIIWEDGKFKRAHTTGPISNLLFGDVIGASFLYKFEVFEKLEGYKKELFLIEDYHFFLKASLHFKFYHLKENLYQYRIHKDSLTGKISEDKIYSRKFEKALFHMYSDIGSNFNMDKKTIKLLVDLYLHKPVALDYYFDNKVIFERDILKYQQKINSPTNPLIFVIRNNWFRNKEEHRLKSLIKVLKYDKTILFDKSYSRKTTLKMIAKCITLG